jgi:hypothetical protein
LRAGWRALRGLPSKIAVVEVSGAVACQQRAMSPPAHCDRATFKSNTPILGGAFWLGNRCAEDRDRARGQFSC